MAVHGERPASCLRVNAQGASVCQATGDQHASLNFLHRYCTTYEELSLDAFAHPVM